VALRRLLALIAAVALIAGAFVVRGQSEEPQVRQDDPTPAATTRPEPVSDGAVVLLCITELKAVCESLGAALADDHDVTVEVRPAAGLLEGGIDAEAAGALLTVDPLPEMLAGRAAGGGGPSFGEGRVLARSPLVAAVWDDRAAVLEAHCGTLSWRCVGDAAGQPGSWVAIGGQEAWGPIKPAHADPASASGLLALGQVAHAYFDRPDVSRRDIDDPGFFGWFSGLERSVPSFSGPPLLTMVQFGSSRLDVAAVVEAEAVGLLVQAAERAGTLRLRAIEPVVTADVVVTPVGEDGRVEALVEAIGREAPDLLAEAGWRVGDGPVQGDLAAVAADLQGLPDVNGLPSGGALEALWRTWSEVAR
jgi:hypothetical protein